MKAKTSGRTERQGVGVAITAFESLGFAFREQAESDFGIDAHAELIVGEQPTGQLLGIQLKTGPSYLSEVEGDNYVFRTDQEHVDYWIGHALPVVLCLCDLDTIFWQIVNPETAITTGKGFKFLVPRTQLVNAASAATFRDMLTPIVSANRYTIFKTDDVSHGGAKRYSLEAVINGTASKAEIASIVRQLTNEGAKRRYYRNHLVEMQWGDSDAHVVWTVIYLSAEDHARRNHICRSIWIREDLPEAFRPLGFDGENVGDNIIVDWSTNYDFLARLATTHTVTKEAYLSQAVPLIDELKRLFAGVDQRLLALSRRELTESQFLATCGDALNRISELNLQVSDLPIAPYECRDMDSQLGGFVAHVDNISLYYNEKGREIWDERTRLELSLQQRSYAIEVRQHLEYEMKKVH